MKVQECSHENNSYKHYNAVHTNSPSFKGGLVVNAMGATMQWIQDKGFLASFLIQDGMGMTAPRVYRGFLRDKEVTGKYNTQEGFEVLGREGLTGPVMMAMAPLMLFLAAKFGRSTSVNSQLIKRFGNSLKELLAKPEFNKALLKNKEAFQKEFFESNIRKMLANTLGEGYVKEDSVKYILDQVLNYAKAPEEAIKAKKGLFKKSKFKNQCLENINQHINNIKFSTSSNLNMLEKVKVGTDGTIKEFSTKDAIDAMVKYSDDAITLNKHLDALDVAEAEKLKNKNIGKRAITNVTTLLSTLGVMFVLPKIYAKSDIAPGARTAMELENQAIAEKDADLNNNVSFKGKGPNKSVLEKIGELVSKMKEKWTSELEYRGHNFTSTLMAGLSIFGLLLPRGLRAVSRAQKDENGKKDLSELWEIIIRDVTSSLAVVFAVPMLTRAFISSYENNTGFVLIQKDRNKSGVKNFIDMINPYSSAHVLSDRELKALYNGINSKEKLVNFCKYIDANNGDLQKILSQSEFADLLFNKESFTIESIAKLTKQEKNAKILQFVESLGKDSDGAIELMIRGAECIDSPEKLAEFCKHIENKNGDLYKILSSSKFNKELFNENTFTLKSIAKLSKQEKNAKIRELVETLGSDKNEIIKKMTSGIKEYGNKIFARAKGLNAAPAFISTFLIMPIVLGWLIPGLTYSNTRRLHAKAAEEKEQAKLNTAV